MDSLTWGEAWELLNDLYPEQSSDSLWYQTAFKNLTRPELLPAEQNLVAYWRDWVAAKDEIEAEKNPYHAIVEAQEIINGYRQNEYGTPERNFATVAEFWTTYLTARGLITSSVTSADVAMLMALLKIGRESNQHKRDNVVDGIAYLELANRHHEGERI